jgi:hypothetical protein
VRYHHRMVINALNLMTKWMPKLLLSIAKWMSKEIWWNDRGREKHKYSEKSLSLYHFAYQNQTWIGFCLNAGFHGDRPPTNRISHGTASNNAASYQLAAGLLEKFILKCFTLHGFRRAIWRVTINTAIHYWRVYLDLTEKKQKVDREKCTLKRCIIFITLRQIGLEWSFRQR